MIDPMYHLIKEDKNLERSVLCEIIMCKTVHPDLKSGFFTGSEYLLFKALKKQWVSNREIDIELLRADHYQAIEEALNAVGTSSELAIERLRSKWWGRMRGDVLVRSEAIDDDFEALKYLQRSIGEILLLNNHQEYDHIATLEKMMFEFERAAKSDKAIRGHSTGITAIDLLTSGIEKSMFYVLGALKKTGKSRFMMHLACKMSDAGYGVLINSLEMNPVQLNACVLSHYSGVDNSRIGQRMPKEQQMAIGNALVKMRDLNFTFSREYGIQDLWQRIEYLKTKRKIDVVFVDYLQKMRDERYKGDRVREVENISQGLANMSRELDVGIIALCQLSGAAERLENDQIPDMSYLKESQGIAENSDCIMIMHNANRHESCWNEQSNSYTFPNFKMKIEQRYGLSGKNIEFVGDLRTCQFWDKSDN